MTERERFGIIGLGYVGLPVALAFAKKHPGTVGFDIAEARIEALRQNRDWTREVSETQLRDTDIHFTANPDDLEECTFFIIAVPTPIDSDRRPDLTPLLAATETLGKVLARPGAVIVYESTVYPGVTEEICGPRLAQVSGLRQSVDFKLGYSPERINPGDTEHTFEKIVKVVSGEDAATLERVARAYESVVKAGVHRASSIRVAEAAKVIENTQRDLNIALMNELALIFDRLGIRTKDVLDAAATKWNFLRFTPGLVGGHCIGVDPYYLTAKAESVGYHPEVILAGRRINDSMGWYVAERTIKLMREQDCELKGSRVGVFGLTFKEQVPDLRNSRVPDIIGEFRAFGIEPLVHDALADPNEARQHYGITLSALEDMSELDALILAVPHQAYLDDVPGLLSRVRTPGVFMDVKAALEPGDAPAGVRYWSL